MLVLLFLNNGSRWFVQNKKNGKFGSKFDDSPATQYQNPIPSEDRSIVYILYIAPDQLQTALLISV